MTERESKKISAFTGIGSLIGVIIGGANLGIQGAMIGGVLGAVLISSGIEVQINQLKSEGKFNPFPGALVLAYVLAIIFTFFAVMAAPIVDNFLTLGGKKPDQLFTIITLYVGPAFIGAIGACIPIWLSPRRKSDKAKE